MIFCVDQISCSFLKKGHVPAVLHLDVNDNNAYWCCTTYPNGGRLLGIGQFLINIHTKLQVQQQGDAGHQSEHRVQAKSKCI